VLAHQFNHQPIDALAGLHLRLHDSVEAEHLYRAHDAAFYVLAQALQKGRRRWRVGEFVANAVQSRELRVRADEQPMLDTLCVQV
jgi:hypothetical protein